MTSWAVTKNSPTPKGDSSSRSNLLTPSEIASLRQDLKDKLARGREILRNLSSSRDR